MSSCSKPPMPKTSRKSIKTNPPTDNLIRQTGQTFFEMSMKDEFYRWDNFMKIYVKSSTKGKALRAYKDKHGIGKTNVSDEKERERRYRRYCAKIGKPLSLNGKLKVPDDFI